MDPFSAMFSLGTAAIGTGLSIFGASKQAGAAKGKAQSEMAIAGDEMQQDAVRRRAMEFDAQRRSIDVARNMQRARALGLAASTNQGGNQGSGLQGGYGQISGQGNTNLFGIQTNLGFGEQMFDLNNQINQEKMKIANYGTEMAKGSMFSSIGAGIAGLSGKGNAVSSLGGEAAGAFNFFAKPGLIGFP